MPQEKSYDDLLKENDAVFEEGREFREWDSGHHIGRAEQHKARFRAMDAADEAKKVAEKARHYEGKSTAFEMQAVGRGIESFHKKLGAVYGLWEDESTMQEYYREDERVSEAFDEAMELGDVNGLRRFWTKAIRDVVDMGLTAGTAGFVGGLPGVYAMYGADTLSREYHGSRRAGLSKGDAWMTAGSMAAIELGTMGAFHAAGKLVPGMGGIEEKLSRTLRKVLGKNTAKDTAARLAAEAMSKIVKKDMNSMASKFMGHPLSGAVWRGGWETVEELITTYGQVGVTAAMIPGSEDAANWHGADGSVWNSPMMNSLKHTFKDTAGAMMLLYGIPPVKHSIRRFLHRPTRTNSKAVEALLLAAGAIENIKDLKTKQGRLDAQEILLKQLRAGKLGPEIEQIAEQYGVDTESLTSGWKLSGLTNLPVEFGEGAYEVLPGVVLGSELSTYDAAQIEQAERALVQMHNKLGAEHGYKLRIVDSEGGTGNIEGIHVSNGATKTIWVTRQHVRQMLAGDPTLTDATMGLYVHEFTHALERSGDYDELYNFVFKNFKGDLLAARKRYEKLNKEAGGKPLSAKALDKEGLAVWMQQNLVNSGMLHKLARSNRTLFERIRNWIYRVSNKWRKDTRFKEVFDQVRKAARENGFPPKPFTSASPEADLKDVITDSQPPVFAPRSAQAKAFEEERAYEEQYIEHYAPERSDYAADIAEMDDHFQDAVYDLPEAEQDEIVAGSKAASEFTKEDTGGVEPTDDAAEPDRAQDTTTIDGRELDEARNPLTGEIDDGEQVLKRLEKELEWWTQMSDATSFPGSSVVAHAASENKIKSLLKKIELQKELNAIADEARREEMGEDYEDETEIAIEGAVVSPEEGIQRVLEMHDAAVPSAELAIESHIESVFVSPSHPDWSVSGDEQYDKRVAELPDPGSHKTVGDAEAATLEAQERLGDAEALFGPDSDQARDAADRVTEHRRAADELSGNEDFEVLTAEMDALDFWLDRDLLRRWAEGTMTEADVPILEDVLSDIDESWAKDKLAKILEDFQTIPVPPGLVDTVTGNGSNEVPVRAEPEPSGDAAGESIGISEGVVAVQHQIRITADNIADTQDDAADKLIDFEEAIEEIDRSEVQQQLADENKEAFEAVTEEDIDERIETMRSAESRERAPKLSREDVARQDVAIDKGIRPEEVTNRQVTAQLKKDKKNAAKAVAEAEGIKPEDVTDEQIEAVLVKQEQVLEAPVTGLTRSQQAVEDAQLEIQAMEELYRSLEEPLQQTVDSYAGHLGELSDSESGRRALDLTARDIAEFLGDSYRVNVEDHKNLALAIVKAISRGMGHFPHLVAETELREQAAFVPEKETATTSKDVVNSPLGPVKTVQATRTVVRTETTTTAIEPDDIVGWEGNILKEGDKVTVKIGGRTVEAEVLGGGGVDSKGEFKKYTVSLAEGTTTTEVPIPPPKVVDTEVDGVPLADAFLTVKRLHEIAIGLRKNGLHDPAMPEKTAATIKNSDVVTQAEVQDGLDALDALPQDVIDEGIENGDLLEKIEATLAAELEYGVVNIPLVVDPETGLYTEVAAAEEPAAEEPAQWKKVRAGEYSATTSEGTFVITSREGEHVETGNADDPTVRQSRDWVILEVAEDGQQWDTQFEAFPTLKEAKAAFQKHAEPAAPAKKEWGHDAKAMIDAAYRNASGEFEDAGVETIEDLLAMKPSENKGQALLGIAQELSVAYVKAKDIPTSNAIWKELKKIPNISIEPTQAQFPDLGKSVMLNHNKDGAVALARIMPAPNAVEAAQARKDTANTPARDLSLSEHLVELAEVNEYQRMRDEAYGELEGQELEDRLGEIKWQEQTTRTGLGDPQFALRGLRNDTSRLLIECAWFSKDALSRLNVDNELPDWMRQLTDYDGLTIDLEFIETELQRISGSEEVGVSMIEMLAEELVEGKQSQETIDEVQAFCEIVMEDGTVAGQKAAERVIAAIGGPKFEDPPPPRGEPLSLITDDLYAKKHQHERNIDNLKDQLENSPQSAKAIGKELVTEAAKQAATVSHLVIRLKEQRKHQLDAFAAAEEFSEETPGRRSDFMVKIRDTIVTSGEASSANPDTEAKLLLDEILAGNLKGMHLSRFRAMHPGSLVEALNILLPKAKDGKESSDVGKLKLALLTGKEQKGLHIPGTLKSLGFGEAHAQAQFSLKGDGSELDRVAEGFLKSELRFAGDKVKTISERLERLANLRFAATDVAGIDEQIKSMEGDLEKAIEDKDRLSGEGAQFSLRDEQERYENLTKGGRFRSLYVGADLHDKERLRFKNDMVEQYFSTKDSTNFEEEQVAAREMLREKGRERILEEMRHANRDGTVLGTEHQIIANIIVDEETDNALDNIGDPEALERASDIMQVVLGVKAAAGRVLRMVGRQTPLQKAKKAIAESFFSPPKYVASQVIKLRRAQRYEEANKLLSEWRNGDYHPKKKNLKGLLGFLNARGIDISNKEKREELMADPYKATELLHLIGQYNARKQDKLFEYWRNSILSGPATQAANVLGTVVFTAYEVALKRNLMAAMNLGIKDPNMPTFGENWALIKAGVASSVADAKDNAIRAFDTEQHQLEFQLAQGGLPVRARGGRFGAGSGVAIGGWQFKNPITGRKTTIGRQIRLPQRGLLAVDEWMKTCITNGYAAGFAYRAAQKQIRAGNMIKGEQSEEFIKQLLDPENRAEAIWMPAYQEALRQTWQQDLPEWGQRIVNVREAYPALRFVMPFITTPVNIFQTGLDMTPIMWLPKALKWNKMRAAGDLREDRVAELGADAANMILVGIPMLLALGQDDDDPWITGSDASVLQGREKYPSGREGDPPPYSIKIPFTDTWLSYARIEPFATAFGATVDLAKAAKAGFSGQITDALVVSFQSVIGQATEKTFLSGIGDIFRMGQASLGQKDPVRGLGGYLSNFTASWVPNIIRAPARALQKSQPDRKVYGEDADKLWQLYQGTLKKTEFLTAMGVLKDLPKVDMWGRDFPRHKSFGKGAGLGDFLYKLFVPMQVRTTHMFVGDEVMRRYNNLNPDEAWTGPNAPERYFTEKGAKKWMSREQYEEFSRMSGKLAAELCRTLDLDVDNPTRLDIKKMQEAHAKSRAITQTALREKWWGSGDESLILAATAEELRGNMVKAKTTILAKREPTWKSLSREERRLPHAKKKAILEGKREALEAQKEEALQWLRSEGVSSSAATRAYGTRKSLSRSRSEIRRSYRTGAK